MDRMITAISPTMKRLRRGQYFGLITMSLPDANAPTIARPPLDGKPFEAIEDAT